ncbi:MAG TPA: DoxX family protein [Steroidobacteraceae bacterium]|jgi:putative oxidoreductase
MNNESLGKLILRLVLGLSILLHGIAKLKGGVGPVGGMLASHGVPAFVAYAAYIGEVVAPIMVIAGWHARIGASLIAINMLVAISLVHVTQLFTLNDQGGWALELQGMYLFSAIAIALLGPGRYSVDKR